jgi:type I restriction enzyme, S subunit
MMIHAISLLDVPSLNIPIYSSQIQTYIGEKVRLAERLRARSRILGKEVFDFHHSLIPNQSGLNFGRKSRRTPFGKISDRLDAHFYPAVVEDYTGSFDI